MSHLDRSWRIQVEGLSGETRADSLRDIDAAARAFVAGSLDVAGDTVELDVRLAAHVPYQTSD